MWAVIPSIYQENTFVVFLKTYPVSAKFTMTKKRRKSDPPDERFGGFISIASSLPDNENTWYIALFYQFENAVAN